MSLYDAICALKDSTAILRATSATKRSELLHCFAQKLLSSREQILQANAKDCMQATHLSAAMQERLALDDKKLQALAQSVADIADLPDPIGRVLEGYKVASGIQIEKVSVPLGVVAIIYESRPNVTSDTAALCLKSANGIVLKGGKESEQSNMAIVEALRATLRAFDMPQELVFFTSSREATHEILQMSDCIDVVIPRGGESLVSFVTQNSTIPVIKHDKGICHAYVHCDADFAKATNIVINAKTQRPSTCNAIETLLVDVDISSDFLNVLRPKLSAKETQIVACPRSLELFESATPADSQSYFTEYGANCLNIRIIANLNEAIEHINHFGSHHSDVIITENYSAAERFLAEVDSACVYVNASTRFSDGGEFGLGAEMGIATSKLHARGPMGLGELTTYKYLIRGNGEVRH